MCLTTAADWLCPPAVQCNSVHGQADQRKPSCLLCKLACMPLLPAQFDKNLMSSFVFLLLHLQRQHHMLAS